MCHYDSWDYSVANVVDMKPGLVQKHRPSLKERDKRVRFQDDFIRGKEGCHYNSKIKSKK